MVKNDNLKPLEICSHQIYLNIWDEFETSVSAENKIRQQMKNVKITNSGAKKF